jgi:tetratricopeptide (TPR) repeat protein
MALKYFSDAAKECTAALKIEPKYMKAFLRRARCMFRLGRYEESLRDYQQWLDILDDAQIHPNNLNECRFDRASEVSKEDHKKTLDEFAEVKLAMAKAEEKARQDAAEKARRRAAESRSQSSSTFDRRNQWYPHDENTANHRGNGNGWNPYERKSGPQPKAYASSENSNRSKSSHRAPNSGNFPSPSSELVTCFYSILQVSQAASQGMRLSFLLDCVSMNSSKSALSRVPFLYIFF